MATQGPNNASTFANDNSNGQVTAWSNPSNAQFSDNIYATAALGAGNEITQYLKVTNFGFGIPSGATIDGIELRIERKYTTDAMIDDTVKLVKGGSISGNNKAVTSPNWPTSDTYRTYGGPTDLWGLSFTPSDINATNFGAVLSGVTVGASGDPQVDNMDMTVYYTPAATSNQGFFF